MQFIEVVNVFVVGYFSTCKRSIKTQVAPKIDLVHNSLGTWGRLRSNDVGLLGCVKSLSVVNSYVPTIRQRPYPNNHEAEPVEYGPGRDCMVGGEPLIHPGRFGYGLWVSVPNTDTMQLLYKLRVTLFCCLLGIEGN